MKYNVYQHWDPLKVCIVGKSYPPEFYRFIENSRVRTVMERIAEETEEDYQKLIKLLESFGVKILRPNVSDDYTEYLGLDNRIMPPPMTPRDYSIMLGEMFLFAAVSPVLTERQWNTWKGVDWPACPKTSEEFLSLPDWIKKELGTFYSINFNDLSSDLTEFGWVDKDVIGRKTWGDVIEYVKKNNDQVYNKVPTELTDLNAAMTTRIGKDIYIGTEHYNQDLSERLDILNQKYSEYRWHIVDTGGHSDGTFCPVVPGLIVSLNDIPTYTKTFPDWEVIYLPGQSWGKVSSFLHLKEKNKGKWWVPGEELNDDFTEFVENWLGHWVGYVEETVFDVNMLVIDEKNVVCNNYNEVVFKAFERYGVTPHVVNFRHRYFWDGGLHCITSDIHREGTLKDYFPGRS
jgi:hypothetical protein